MSTEHEFESAMGFLRPEAEVIDEFPIFWLSDLDSKQLKRLTEAWHKLTVTARRKLMTRMEGEARDAFELDFVAIARTALHDSDAEVRVHAIQALWECTDKRLADEFLQMMQTDPDASVRAAAAGALGGLVYHCEMSEPPPAVKATMENALIRVVRGKDTLDVRRNALEALGYSSRDEVAGLIDRAFHEPEERMRASALRAMGRSADAVWEKDVTQELDNLVPLIRMEAARAAGELTLMRAMRRLMEMLDDVDEGVRREVIRSLGEIGGEKALVALEEMKEKANAAEQDLIKEAIEEVEFDASLENLEIFHLGEDEDEEEDGDAIEGFDEEDDEAGEEEDDADEEESDG